MCYVIYQLEFSTFASLKSAVLCLYSRSGVVLLCQLLSTTEGDPKPSAPAQPKPVQAFSAPPVHTSPPVPNLHMAGPINPTAEQVASFPSNCTAALVLVLRMH